MRIYQNETIQLKELYCNCCGRKLQLKDGIVREGVIRFEQNFGYFSGRDGETHRFDLCEECYNKMIRNFTIPVEIKETEELI